MPEPMVVGQAVYAFSSETIDSRESKGAGIVAASESLTERLSWLRNATRPVSHFVGNVEGVTEEERYAYEPLGRIVQGGEAILFKKFYTGNDASRRIGRYAVHFLIGQRELLTLSVLYNLDSAYWLTEDQVPSDEKISVSDLQLTELMERHAARRDWQLDSASEQHSVQGARALVSHGELDVAKYSHAEVLGLLSCLPAWVDANGELRPEWTKSGPKAILTVPEVAPHIRPADYRVPFNSIVLREVQAELSEIWQVGTARRASVPLEPSKQDSANAAVTPRNTKHSRLRVGATGRKRRQIADAATLPGVVQRWQQYGRRGLSGVERELLMANPEETFRLIAASGKGIPYSRTLLRADDLALGLIEVCANAPYWALVTPSLLVPSPVIANLVRNVPTVSLILAIFQLNSQESRRIDISIDVQLPRRSVSAILATASANENLTKGLKESIRISFNGNSSFLRNLLSAESGKTDWLYRTVLPEAFAHEQMDLIYAVAERPDQILTWLGVPATYRPGLAQMLMEARADRSRRPIFQRYQRF